jgi:hypothetical protein
VGVGLVLANRTRVRPPAGLTALSWCSPPVTRGWSDPGASGGPARGPAFDPAVFDQPLDELAGPRPGQIVACPSSHASASSSVTCLAASTPGPVTNGSAPIRREDV